MTIGVEEHTVICLLSAAFTSPDDMMAVPSCQFGDFPGAERAEATLLFPEMEQLSFPFEVVCHFHIETLFKVGLPFGIVRICRILDFDVPLDGDTLCLEQSNGLNSPVLSKDFAVKDPVLPCDGGEVFLPYPFDGFLWVPPFGPLPQDAKDGVVHL